MKPTVIDTLFSEDELFKASIIQNNSDVQKQFKELFKQIHNNVSEFSELGPERIVERLNKGKLLNDFDFIKSTLIGNREIGGVHTGIVRQSLLNVVGIPNEHLKSYQNVRKPLMALSQIIESLKNPSFAKDFKISPTTATKIRGQLENFFKGERGLQEDIKKINKQLGDVKFKNIFGGVNFEHTLAKQFGKDYKYLPRNYLLKGQFTSKAFNMMKRDAFDLPLINLMKQYKQGEVSGAKVQAFIDDFNAKTNNYADFKFDVDKGKLGYTSDSVTYDLSRYDNPNVARQELIDNIKLTQSDTFQKGMKNTVGSGNQLKLFKSKEAKEILSKLEKLGCGRAAGGRILFSKGTPGGRLTDCALAGQKKVDRIIATGKGTDKELSIAKKLLKFGKESVSLRGLFGPQATALFALTEAGLTGYDVAKGKPLKEAIGKNLNYLLGPKWKQDVDELEYKRLEGSGVDINQLKLLKNSYKDFEKLEELFNTQYSLEQNKGDRQGRPGMAPRDTQKSRAQRLQEVNSQIADMSMAKGPKQKSTLMRAAEIKSDPSILANRKDATDILAAQEADRSILPDAQSAFADDRRRLEKEKERLALHSTNKEVEQAFGFRPDGIQTFSDLNKFMSTMPEYADQSYGITKVGPQTGQYNVKNAYNEARKLIDSFKPEFGYYGSQEGANRNIRYSEGGITGLRSKYEYKK